MNSGPCWRLADTPRDDHRALRCTHEKTNIRVTEVPRATRSDRSQKWHEGPLMVEHDQPASGEAVLRECVARPVSISVSQLPHNVLFRNLNLSSSEFASCLPDWFSKSMPQLHTNEHGIDTSIMPRLAKSLATRTSTILSRTTTCPNCIHYLSI
jgi:hypothetical protein